MSKIIICPMNEHISSACKFVRDYLPDSDIEEVKHFMDIYTEAAKVLTDADKVIGAVYGQKYQGAEDRGFVLNGIAVEEIYQRKGYGTMLLNSIEQAALIYGCKKVSLGSARSAEQFYIKNGYKPSCYKICDNGQIKIYREFNSMREYEEFKYPSENGFTVFEKSIV